MRRHVALIRSDWVHGGDDVLEAGLGAGLGDLLAQPR
jgi:hypothetical protein